MEKKTPIVKLRKDPNTLNVSNQRNFVIIPEYKLYLDYGTDNDEVLEYSKNIIEEIKGIYDDTICDKKREIVLRKYSHGLVYYGYTEWYGKKAENGTLFRTTTDIINSTLNVNVFDVVITKWNSAWMSMMVSDIEPLLPEGYSIVFIPESFDYFKIPGWHIIENSDKVKVDNIMGL